MTGYPGAAGWSLRHVNVKFQVGSRLAVLGEYIRTVKGGVIEPQVNNNWKLVGNNWKAAEHDQAVALLREGKLHLSENEDSRTLPAKAITQADLKKV